MCSSDLDAVNAVIRTIQMGVPVARVEFLDENGVRSINAHDKLNLPEKPLLLFANPQDERFRIRHTLQVSDDDGATWPASRRLLLDEGKGFGYPSVSRVDDDHIGIVYEGSQSHLVFERISRDELTAPSK